MTGRPVRVSTSPGQPRRKRGAVTLARRIVCQPTDRRRTSESVRTSALSTSTTGPAGPTLKAVTVEPGETEAAAAGVHFPVGDRVDTYSVDPRTNATDGTAFPFSARNPSWTPRATTSAEAPTAVTNAIAAPSAAERSILRKLVPRATDGCRLDFPAGLAPALCGTADRTHAFSFLRQGVLRMHRPRGTLAAHTITKSYRDTVVLDGLSLSVTPASRIGVVGPNGIGKSTLLRVLAGLEEPDAGRVSREPPGLEVAYLVQERAVDGLSGGEAARRNLEAILTADADVLLLDEPTNDLDFAALELLERFVDRHRGGVVAVSHDRAFLERMTSIVEFEAETRRVRVYSGGWSEFVAQRSAGRHRHEAAYAGYVSERARLEEQARRMRQWEERGYGQGRRKKKTKDIKKASAKKLGQLEQVEKPWTPWQLQLSFSRAQRGGNLVARLSGAVV